VKNICKVKDCESRCEGLGYCSKHYQRFRRHADHRVVKKRGSIITPFQRFKNKVKVNKETGCWEWQAGLNIDGYGQFWYENSGSLAHRWSYEHFIGKIPKGLCACHHCDNPCCVNPDHLFLGIQKDNMIDRDNKNRQAKGERQGAVKLDSNIVKTIRTLYKKPEHTQETLAKKFDISQSTISNINTKKVWKHI